MASADSGSAQASSTQEASVPAQQGPPDMRQRAPEVQQDSVEAEATPEVSAPLAGDPLSLGLPSFIVGSVALGMVLVGFVSPLGAGASLPIILAATAAGLFISTLWAMGLGQSAGALVLGGFAGFWLSYPLPLLGLFHHWFGIRLAGAKATPA